MSKRKRGLALRRRYGHFGLKDIQEGTAGIRKLAADNPLVTAAAIGATIGAVSAGMTPASAAAVGSVAGVAVQQAMKR
jgi:hypothetical protein